LKTLIVDDEEGICKRLQRELKKGGLEAEYTTSPIGVIERLHNTKVKEEPYELLLLDLRMPEMGGFELLKEIRKAHLDLDVIIITGYGDEGKAIEAVRLGAVDYLRKPISLEELHTAIFRVQQKRTIEAKQALRHSILVVDDEEDLCTRIKRELDKEGYQTAIAYDGVEGLDYFKNHRVDIVIADIRMPRMNGLEMLKACREITDDFVSIIITGHGDHETAIEALKLGVSNYLKKPVSLEELVISVDKGIDLVLLRRGLSARRRELEIETAIKEQYAKNLEKMVEERTKDLQRVSQALRALSICNQAMLHATEESQLLHEICRVIVEVCGYRLAWVGFAEQDVTKTVRPVAQAGYEEGYLESVNITWADTKRGRGTTGTAIRTAKLCVCKNILTDPDYAPWRNEAIKHGYASSISLPLITNGQTFGALNIYAAEPDAFDAEEVNLLMQLAGDLAYGIVAIRTRAEHKRAEEALRKSEERFRSLVETTSDWIWEVDENAVYIYASPKIKDILEYEPCEVIGKTPFDLMPADKAERVAKLFLDISQARRTFERLENVNRHKDGRLVVLETSGVPILDTNGKFRGYRGIDREITERKRAEDALWKSEKELKKRVKELEEFYQMAVGRELKMVELKKEMESLREELERYKNP
jgi:PAS domain S-box-containing protein